MHALMQIQIFTKANRAPVAVHATMPSRTCSTASTCLQFGKARADPPIVVRQLEIVRGMRRKRSNAAPSAGSRKVAGKEAKTASPHWSGKDRSGQYHIKCRRSRPIDLLRTRT